MKMERAIYDKTISDNEPMSCWYCEGKAFGTLTFPNGDEVWSCVRCAGLKGKVKKFRGKRLVINQTT